MDLEAKGQLAAPHTMLLGVIGNDGSILCDSTAAASLLEMENEGSIGAYHCGMNETPPMAEQRFNLKLLGN